MRTILWVAASAAAISVAVAAAAQKSGKPSAPAVSPGSKYGALAVDRGQGFAYGFAYDQDTRAAAVARAIEECAKRGGKCSTVVEFAGPGCAAYRTVSASDGSAYGWGVNSSREAAESRAAEECGKFAGGKLCTNHVWSCNSGEGKFAQLKLDPVRPASAKTDCLVQYELQIYKGKDWASRFYSPLYRLSAKDCPLAGKSEYHSFGYSEHPGEKPRNWEVNADRKDAVKQKRGLDWAHQFYSWMAARSSPVPGYTIQPAVMMSVSDVTPDNLKYMTEKVAKRDPGDSRALLVGQCVGYTPPGVTPVEILGAEKCQRWFR